MGSLELTLEKSLELATKEGARADVLVLGALSAASIMTKNHFDEFDPDMLTTITHLVDYLQQTIGGSA